MFAKKLIVSVMLLFSLLGFPTKDTASEIKIVPLTVSELVVKYSKEYGVSANLMSAIIKCESKAYSKAVNENINKQGKVWSRDWGSFQINDYYHKAAAAKMGLSIYDEEDNIHYGAYLLSKQGTKPWNASKYCWSKKSL